MNLTIIGGGNMGSAIARSLIKNSDINLTISDPTVDKLAEFQTQGATVTSNNQAATSSADAIIIAIKPQYIDSLFAELKDQIPTNALIISIAAGVTIERFQTGFNHQQIVRVMPNTPAQINQGVSGWFASAEVTEAQKAQVKTILQSFGQEVEVENESLIDAVTAVSGSGPAYFFYFLEHIIKGGVACGLTESQAKDLAIQTAIGAAHLAEQSEDDLATLRQKVTSKGGTTEAAINSMVESNVGESISTAIQKANQRAKEL